ncbi:Uncharacterized protein APZ42_027702 [Daphnia magna]|uniref:Uncharacterized protein n=1 Tax=Daphnia magna TaxID=35525 RepID=A0A164R6C5_9CRUS|nr:Uncharacterized protein APZ42_027702 [Daphnia magna]
MNVNAAIFFFFFSQLNALELLKFTSDIADIYPCYWSIRIHGFASVERNENNKLNAST